MNTSTFGKTGERVSRLGFGCMRLPLLDPTNSASIDVAAATAMVRKAIDGGVNYIDTAYPYHRSGDMTTPGESEPFLGKCLRDGYRAKVLIATKLPTWFMENRQQMEAILDAQLQRLGVDHIDFYLAHNLNRSVWPKMRDIGMLDFLDKAKRDGKIRHIGFSFHDHYSLFEELLNAYDWSFAQIQLNYLDVDFQAGLKGLRLAADKGLGMTIMEPLRGGFLINHVPEEMRAMLRGVRPDWSMADWGLRWLWSQPGVNVVLSGMSDMAQTEENVAIANAFAPFRPEESAAIDRVRTFFLERIKVNCTGCGYCLPCPCGVNIPKVFVQYNDYHLVDTDANRQRTKQNYRFLVAPAESAAHCVSCARCEVACPQNIPISREMPQAAALFK